MTSTIPFFVMGFLASSYFLFKASRLVKEQGFSRQLITLVVGNIILVLSTLPYKIDNFFKNTHIAIALVFGIYQYYLVFSLLKKSNHTKIYYLARALLTISIFAALLTTSNLVRLLFTAQITLGLALGTLLVTRNNRLSANHIEV